MKTKIAPCSFCESTEVVLMGTIMKNLKNANFFVKCETCGAQGSGAKHDETAIKVWNMCHDSINSKYK